MTNKEIIKEFRELYDTTSDIGANLTAEEIETFWLSKLAQQKADLLEKIEKFIVEEIIICNEENQPTSRLTSLSIKISKNIGKNNKQ